LLATLWAVTSLGISSRRTSPFSRTGDPELDPVLRIRDVYNGSRIRIFPHPGSRISYPGSNQKRGGKLFFLNLFNFLPTKYELGAHDLRVYGLREDDLREYYLREYDLREYDLHEYGLREDDLREYDLREYDLLPCEQKNI